VIGHEAHRAALEAYDLTGLDALVADDPLGEGRPLASSARD
jgi:hypothetical protein